MSDPFDQAAASIERQMENIVDIERSALTAELPALDVADGLLATPAILPEEMQRRFPGANRRAGDRGGEAL